jgi:hypothetical protein
MGLSRNDAGEFAIRKISLVLLALVAIGGLSAQGSPRPRTGA